MFLVLIILFPLPKGTVLGFFPKNFSQVATFKMCNFPSGSFPKDKLGAAGCNGGQALRLG